MCGRGLQGQRNRTNRKKNVEKELDGRGYDIRLRVSQDTSPGTGWGRGEPNWLLVNNLKIRDPRTYSLWLSLACGTFCLDPLLSGELYSCAFHFCNKTVYGFNLPLWVRVLIHEPWGTRHQNPI